MDFSFFLFAPCPVHLAIAMLHCIYIHTHGPWFHDTSCIWDTRCMVQLGCRRVSCICTYRTFFCDLNALSVIKSFVFLCRQADRETDTDR